MTSVTLSRGDGVGVLRLCRPPNNELDLEMLGALCTVAERELPDLDVEGLVVTGQGRHFSSGAKVDELCAFATSENHEAVDETLKRHCRALTAFSQLPYPTVAAIRGCCLGVGLELALACDSRVAAPGALLAFPEAQHDLMPGCGATARLPRLVGARQAMSLLLRGEPLMAPEALEVGLIDAVAPSAASVVDVARQGALR